MNSDQRLLECQRDLFAIPESVAFFNCANVGPLMRPALAAGQLSYERRAQPWRIDSEDWFGDVERRRALFASLVGVAADNVALVSAASYGLAIAARNLRISPAKKVLVLDEDFPSNVYTWRRYCSHYGSELLTVRREAGQEWTEAVLGGLDERIGIVAVPNVHWTDGAMLDLRAISARARAVGARLVVDASQSLGMLPLDFAAVRPDFVVTVGYKWLLGPYGLAYLYVADEHLEGEPLEENWVGREGSEDFARLVDYRDEYRTGARRFDVGERAFFEATRAAIAVLEKLAGWGCARISATLADKVARILAAATQLGFTPTTRGARAPHMLGLALPRGIDDVAARMRERNVYVSVRGSAMRISPHVYNSDGDIAVLTSALATLVPG